MSFLSFAVQLAASILTGEDCIDDFETDDFSMENDFYDSYDDTYDDSSTTDDISFTGNRDIAEEKAKLAHEAEQHLKQAKHYERMGEIYEGSYKGELYNRDAAKTYGEYNDTIKQLKSLR